MAVMAGNVISTAVEICKIRACSNQFKKEIEMFTQRLFKVTVAVMLVVAGLLAVRPFAKASAVPSSSGSSNEQAAYEYHMHERYGETVPEELLARVAALKAAHEYRMHEWYGESVPEDLLARVAAIKAARENRLREGP
jgi:hypothetical protein